MDESDLMELPPSQSSKASFPPGCNVWIHSNELLPRSVLDTSAGGEESQDFAVHEGTVCFVFLGDVFSISRKFYYKVEIAGDRATEIVEESKLTFAKNTAVSFFGGESDGTLSFEAQEGEILTAVCYGKEDSDKVQIAYSLMLFSEGNKLVVKHGVRPGQLRFRSSDAATPAPGQESLGSVDERVPSLVESKHDVGTVASEQGSFVSINQCPTGLNTNAKLPPPGFVQMAPKENSEDGSFVMIGSRSDKVAPTIQKKLQIPSWLVANDASRTQVIGRYKYGSLP